MKRLSLSELERRCQKPEHRRVGNWMARRITRPAALRVTRVIAPYGISANAATLAAWSCGVAAAVAFYWGAVWGWILGAGLLQLWYLLDHVDGQLARLRGTASLDGVQLDYLMHHTVNLLPPLGIGAGLARQTGSGLWATAGLAWGVSALLITAHHDARYKAFIQRLKRVRGRLEVLGGGGARPQPQPPIPRHPIRLAVWVARKACEIHVVANVLALLAIGQLVVGDAYLLAGRVYLAIMAPTAAAIAGWTIFHSQQTATAEREFAAWFRVPSDCDLTFADGWWDVQSTKDRELTKSTKNP